MVLGGCGGGEGGDSTDSAASPPGGKPGQSTDSTQRLETLQEPVIAPVLDDEPPLELVPPVLDFGVVAPNATSQGAVRLFNRSEEPMLILAVEPSCKCTALDDIAGRTIAPGESIDPDIYAAAHEKLAELVREGRAVEPLRERAEQRLTR